MQKIGIGLLFAILFSTIAFIVISSFQTEETDFPSSHIQDAWTGKNGLTYTLSLKEEGDIITLTGTVENNTGKDFTFGGNPCAGEIGVGLLIDGSFLQGEGDILPDMCIEPYYEFTLPQDTELIAEAKYSKKTIPKGTYDVVVAYAKERFSTTEKFTK